MEDKYKAAIAVTGIICVTILEYQAINQNIDGTLFGTVIGAITLLVGLAFGVYLGRKQ